MAILELTHKLSQAKNFSIYLKNAIEMASNTSNILNILPQSVRNFTFFRISADHEFNMVTSKPLRGFKYAKSDFWQYDVTTNPHYLTPIFDRKALMPKEVHASYERFLREIGGQSCIATNYQIGKFKDTFIYVFSENITKDQYADLYASLHNIAIAFYHLEIKYHTTFRLPTKFIDNHKRRLVHYQYDSFEALIDKHQLTQTKAKYLLPLALHMPLDYIAFLFCKSRRTVEKNIDEIRDKFNVYSKFELCQLLSSYHICQVQKYTQSLS